MRWQIIEYLGNELFILSYFIDTLTSGYLGGKWLALDSNLFQSMDQPHHVGG